MRARDIMTKNVLSVEPTVPVAKAAAMLAKRGYNALPVVDRSGDLIGIVTEADLIGNRFPFTEAAAEAGAATGPAATVAEVMTSPVVGVSHDTDVSIVAREMLVDRRRSLPIVDGSALVGVITRRDIVRALARSDEEIASDVRAKLGVIGGLTRWSAQVGNGDVVLHDRYREASDRDIARALVESVPGVISVTIRTPDDENA
ncbi:MAG TPA: CBS domain-containing protein [Nakamurella multipartita]|nr:CBS domain-containing protein [Nakamurella multipartita]